MSALTRTWRTWLTVIVFTGLCVWFVGSSKSFQQCIRDTKKTEAQQTTEESIAKFSIALGRYKGCTGTFITDNHDAIAASSTFIIAVFTITLWLATTRLWRTSETHAGYMERSVAISEQALVALNRPYILFHDPKSIIHMLEEGTPLRGDVITPSLLAAQAGPRKIASMDISVSYSLINRGRTVAIIHGIGAELYIGDELPGLEYGSYADELRQHLARSHIIRAYIIPECHACPDRLSTTIDDPVTCAAIIEGKRKIFLYGWIFYSDMFLRKAYVTGQALERQGMHYITVESETYNYDGDETEIRKRFGMPPRTAV